MESITNTHLFGILLTVGLFYLISLAKHRTRQNWLNPLLLSVIIIICILILADIPYDHYMKGGSVIHAFLGPVTVVLALPLYRQRKLLALHKYAILGGIITGVASAILSVVGLSRILGLNEMLERSLVPHSVTTPIGIAVSNMLNATQGITIISIIITGIIGASIAPFLLKFLRIKHPVAKGLSIGASSHALGTTKAIEMGETEAAMSSLAIGVAALTTVLVVILMQLMGWY
ncbi:LrgB family protein [Mangrovibacterium diazotrophicum]|uniref:Putative murein hydrolase (TIGR00659 family) n=1 Tax=Mangrovibacterium diazotrophicum TaxID=1261403 RepID=A0A419W355_9BACT|nr:LrgB family protein [Mangrovibacterium diazotrophicum]RKD89916.1 putative murein hydrolase (TIGR00659 family) [Mangrovibacterium diazotrophicum]